MNELYDMFFKRKSVRKFDSSMKLSEEELVGIRSKLSELKPLFPDIKVTYEIVPREETTCKWGEYCLLVYSEEKDDYLINVGYLLEQLDLYMASVDIGTCWYGFGKGKEDQLGNQKFVIMFAIGKSKAEDFRKDYTKAERNELHNIWDGQLALDAAGAARYAPSACNSQPWRVRCNGNQLEVYRSTDIKSVFAKWLVAFYNKIDMGIFLCFLEIALNHHGYEYKRLMVEEDTSKDLIPVAVYELIEN